MVYITLYNIDYLSIFIIRFLVEQFSTLSKEDRYKGKTNEIGSGQNPTELSLAQLSLTLLNVNHISDHTRSLKSLVGPKPFHDIITWPTQNSLFFRIILRKSKFVRRLAGFIEIQPPNYPDMLVLGTDLGMKQKFGKGKLTKMFYSTSNFWYNKSLFEKDNFA